MGIYCTLSWLLIILLQVEASTKIRLAPGFGMAYLENWQKNKESVSTTIKSEKPYDAFDSEVLQKARHLQEALVPLPGDVISSLSRSSASLYLPIKTNSGLCRSHSQHTLHSVHKSEMWALRMLDASSKVPSGVLDGLIQDLGNYDQCLRVEETEQKFKGRYCMVEARGLLSDSMRSYFRNMVSFALCVPSTCDSQDIMIHLDRSIKDAGLNVSTDKFIVFCSSNEPRPFTAEDWFTVAIYSTIIALIILSTWYESKTSEEKSELLYSFSVISNWQVLKDTEAPPSDVSCLNGLRTILAFFVVIIHRYFYCQVFKFTSYLEMKNDPWMNKLLWSSTLLTEIFILISGIIRAHSFIQNRRSNKLGSIFKKYIQRYFRVTPSMAIIVLFSSTLQIHLSDGPFWDRYMDISKFVCSNLWWSNLLLISSCLGTPILCLVETWFLAVDFQLFLLSPLLLLPLLHRPKLGMVLLAVVYVLSSAFRPADTFLNQIHSDISLDKRPNGDLQHLIASCNTIHMAASYVVGLAVGFFILEVQSGRVKIALSKFLVWLGWILSVSISLWTSIVFVSPSYEDTPWLTAIYIVLVQRLWVLGTAWMILACTFGYGGWLEGMLSWSGFLPVARLSSGIYLVHFCVQTTHIYRMRQPSNMDPFAMVLQCISDYTVSAGLATVLYLAVEMPCSRVVNHLLHPSAGYTAESSQSNGMTRDQREKIKDN